MKAVTRRKSALSLSLSPHTYTYVYIYIYNIINKKAACRLLLAGLNITRRRRKSRRRGVERSLAALSRREMIVPVMRLPCPPIVIPRYFFCFFFLYFMRQRQHSTARRCEAGPSANEKRPRPGVTASTIDRNERERERVTRVATCLASA